MESKIGTSIQFDLVEDDYDLLKRTISPQFPRSHVQVWDFLKNGHFLENENTYLACNLLDWKRYLKILGATLFPRHFIEQDTCDELSHCPEKDEANHLCLPITRQKK
ncbi:hypothetical protein H6P81_018676 [Aristolochia fimbriata]|uniref:Uncharacterized protein n=1 Tax=Aristolochia fimbriata TaxID=158543 RepID=A0AAV7E200_ARIFI|nr:hypothetical protein H6P81_018676 [Aristolochia fimbriata]